MTVKHRRNRIEVYKGKDGDYWWRLRASNGKVRADSSEGYRRLGACLNAAEGVRLAFVTAEITWPKEKEK